MKKKLAGETILQENESRSRFAVGWEENRSRTGTGDIGLTGVSFVFNRREYRIG